MKFYYDGDSHSIMESPSIISLNSDRHSDINGNQLSEIEILKRKLVCNASKITLPKTVPQSTIVFAEYDNDNDDSGNNKDSKNGDWIKCTKIKCYLLYCKYLRVGSEYELNIGWKTRQNLSQLLDNKEKWMANETIDEKTLLLIFNSSAREMINLINGSFTRFKSNPKFKKLVMLKALKPGN